MCDKHETESEDYELCDNCGEKEQCGHLYEVWTSQKREVYDYWCYECKAHEAYRCKRCGELFPENSGYVAVPAGGQDWVDYICYDCLLKEHGENRDMLFITEFIRDSDLRFYAPFFRAGVFNESIEMKQLRCLWTTYCLKYGYNPDTLGYDQEIMKLYANLNKFYPDVFIWRPEDMNEDEKSLFDEFDLFMGGYLV